MSDLIQQHFVTFYSPGTFFSEESCRSVERWDATAAIAMSAEIVERYGARPYGFRFTTRGRSETELDSRELARSSMHYIGGKIETLEEIEQRCDPSDRILLANMRGNRWDRVWTSTSGWKTTQPLYAEDVVHPVPDEERSCVTTPDLSQSI